MFEWFYYQYDNYNNNNQSPTSVDFHKNIIQKVSQVKLHSTRSSRI